MKNPYVLRGDGTVGGDSYLSQSAVNMYMPMSATINHYPAVGRHFYSWNEYSVATGTTNWAGVATGSGFDTQSGISGFIQG